MNTEPQVLKEKDAAFEKLGHHLSPASRFGQSTAFLANLAVIIGILFAYAQIHQARELERCRIAIAAVEATQSAQFLDALQKLRESFADDPTMSSPSSLREPLSLVLNVYNNIAILYLRGMADEELVEATTHQAVTDLIPILDALKISQDVRRNIDLLANSFSKTKEKK